MVAARSSTKLAEMTDQQAATSAAALEPTTDGTRQRAKWTEEKKKWTEEKQRWTDEDGRQRAQEAEQKALLREEVSQWRDSIEVGHRPKRLDRCLVQKKSFV